MRMMVDMGSRHGGPIPIMDTPTSVECGRGMRLRRYSLRSLVECMVPCCTGLHPSHSLPADDYPTTAPPPQYYSSSYSTCNDHHYNNGINGASNISSSSNSSGSSTVTGTFFGYRKGRVSFCLQEDTKSLSPLLLLEFAVPTAYLAREMQHGLLRIALECDRATQQRQKPSPPATTTTSNSNSNSSSSLFNVPVWSMYCNGRKVGFAIRRQMTQGDVRVLKLMQSVSVGAGVLPHLPPPNNNDHTAAAGGGDLMFLRATFERVVGSADSQSFHMINPVGSSGQQLSVFLLRS
ncbi:hypothetical protein Tsubulata_046165 [Turnera subulata]|uniref:Protein MIZU-KUSSEI 1 n=1 Tax=Turnera subulata TaxID=218843 RepID=A0A9Q0G9P7_9ROSI|nr:hypothetical protein Tsubulata_046165 [Turnera subulata]